MKYVKKPIVIEAVQWNGENLEELITFLGGADTRNDYFGNLFITGKNFVYGSIDPKSVCTNVIMTQFCQLPQSTITIGLTIKTLEGDMTASVGDYIIKGIKGEYYPCKPDIFEQSYDPAVTETAAITNGTGSTASLFSTAGTTTSTTVMLPNGDIFCGSGTTGSSLWHTPELIKVQVNDLHGYIEMIYKQTSMISLSVYPPRQPEERVFKIVYSCVKGKWNKSEPIFGKIIPAQNEYYEFD